MSDRDQALRELLQAAEKIKQDPTRFAEYADEPLRFCEEVLGVKLWPKQEKALELLVEAATAAEPGRAAIRSGHNVGKTFLVSCASLWWLYGRQGIVITTAPTKHHLVDALWREIHTRLARAPVYLPGEPNKLDITISPTWFMKGVTTDEEGAFQGRHHPRLLIIGDEGPALSEQTLLEMDTCASASGNVILLIGNPTQVSGTFYQAFKSGGRWKTMKISCLEHPNVVEGKVVVPGAVDKAWVEDKRRNWGETHPLWHSRVLGDFPAVSARGVIPLAWVERAQNDERREQERGKAVARKEPCTAGLDVARYGDNLCVFTVRSGDAVVHIEAWGHSFLTETAGRTKKLCEEWRVDTLVVDAAGLGAGVHDILQEQELSFKLYGHNGGHTAAQRGTFSNRRTELWWHLRQRFEQERLWLPEKGFEVEKLIGDLTAPEYELTPNGRIKVWTKEKMTELGIPSPDFADSLCLCFAADPELEAELLPKPSEAQDPQVFVEIQAEPLDFTMDQMPIGF